MKTIVIIDDEIHVRQTLRTLLDSLCPQVRIVGEAENVRTGIQLIRATNPDAILLDISMEDGSGFDILDVIPKHSCKVIFVTAYDEFAIKAIKYSALDYLLKPIVPQELVEAIQKLEQSTPESYDKQILQLLDSHKKQAFERITLHTQESLIFVRLEEIIRLEAEGSYTFFYLLHNSKHLISRPLKDFENLLPSASFFRVHQSHIVRTHCVRKIIKQDGGYAEMIDGSKIPIARRRKNEFLKFLE